MPPTAGNTLEVRIAVLVGVSVALSVWNSVRVGLAVSPVQEKKNNSVRPMPDAAHWPSGRYSTATFVRTSFIFARPSPPGRNPGCGRELGTQPPPQQFPGMWRRTLEVAVTEPVAVAVAVAVAVRVRSLLPVGFAAGGGGFPRPKFAPTTNRSNANKT